MTANPTAPAGAEPISGEANRVAYAEVPYGGGAHALTHPGHLGAIGRLFGIRVAPPERARILEIGCAEGRNLLPLAAQLPDAELVGIDLASGHIATAQAGATALRLPNVRFIEADIDTFDVDIGTFDYIIVHGVYSWLPTTTRRNLLALVARLLAPCGLAHVSYNAYPGWHRREALREMMLFHVDGIADPHQRIAEARAFLNFLTGASSPFDAAYKLWLQQEAQVLKSSSDAYIFHEFLAPNNAPCYMHQFVNAASAHGLRYVGDAMLAANFGQLLPAQLADALSTITHKGRIAFEQYQDFVLNRPFRQTILTHADASLKTDAETGVIADFHVWSRCTTAANGTASESGSTWTRAGEPLSGVNAPTAGLLGLLAARWPATMPVSELFTRYQGLALDESESGRAIEAFCEDLLRLHINDIIELRTTPVTRSGDPTYPELVPWARIELAAGQSRLTTLHHTPAKLSDTLIELARLCDGTRDHAALVRGLRQANNEGRLNLPIAEATIEQLQTGLDGGVTRGLQHLEKMGLLT